MESFQRFWETDSQYQLAVNEGGELLKIESWSYLPATEKHTSWSQNHPIQDNLQRAYSVCNCPHSSSFSFNLFKRTQYQGQEDSVLRRKSRKAEITSSSEAGTGEIWWEAWNMLKWYTLEFWNQIANKDPR